MLPPVYAEIRSRLEGHDVVFLVGSHAFSAHYYTPVSPIPDGTTVVQLDSDRDELGRTYPAAIALHGGIKPSLAALAARLEAREPYAEPAQSLAMRRHSGPEGASGSDAAAVARALVAALPDDAVLIEEGITTGIHVRREFAASRPGSFHHSVGGALGWGIGGGIGVKLARPEVPVVAAVGTAARCSGSRACGRRRATRSRC